MTLSAARITNANNIGERIKAHKRVSKADLAEYEEVKSILDSEKSKPIGDPLDVALPVVAAFFGVSQKCIHNDWCKVKGAPKVSYGVYNLKAMFDWWMQNIMGGGDSEEMAGHKVRYWKEMADGKEIDNKERLGEFITKDEVKTQWLERFGEARQALLSLPNRVPEECREQVKGIVRQVLEGLSRPGKHCPKGRGKK